MIKKQRLKSDNGASATIELVIMMLLLFSILLTVIDFGIYFNNRNIVVNVAQNGARLAAVYGGVSENAISRLYGENTIDSNCRRYVSSPNKVSCAVYHELAETRGTTNLRVKNITCGPNKTTKIGQRTYCQISWKYTPLGGPLSLANVMGTQLTKMTAETEVILK